jgi:hypothetical protein
VLQRKIHTVKVPSMRAVRVVTVESQRLAYGKQVLSRSDDDTTSYSQLIAGMLTKFADVEAWLDYL